MTALRRALAPLTAIWLCCHVGTMALAPAAAWLTAGDPLAAECECGHGAGAMCPMHHKPSNDSTRCAMRAADTSGFALLASFATLAGAIAEPTVSLEIAAPTIAVRSTHGPVIGERPVPPDPPPPRR